MNNFLQHQHPFLTFCLFLGSVGAFMWACWSSAATWPPDKATVLTQSQPYIDEVLDTLPPIQWNALHDDYVSQLNDTTYAVQALGYCVGSDGIPLYIEYLCLMSYPLHSTKQGCYTCHIMWIKRDDVVIYEVE